MSSQPRAQARRAHKKSRAGCRQCKQRKVKCDEVHPLCGNCAKHFIDLRGCDWEIVVSKEEEPDISSSSSLPSRTRTISAAPTIAPITGRPLAMKPPLPPTISAGMLDPFTARPDTKVSDVDMLMHHYLTTFVFRSFPFFNTSAVVQLWWPFVRQDKAMVHVILQLGALSLERLQQVWDSRRSKLLMAESIQILKSRIVDGVAGTSDETIVAVANLMAIEYERGNMRSYKVHLSGLKRMVGLRDGLDAIKQTSPMVASIVFWMAMVTMNDSEFLPLNFREPEQRQAGSAHEESRDPDHLDLEQFGVEKTYSRILIEVDDLSRKFTEQINANSPQEGLHVVNQLSSLLQQLIRLPPPVRDDSLLRSISESCRYAAVLHVFFPLCGHYPDPTLMVHSLVSKLKSSLGPMILSLGSNNSLLLWLLSVGAVSALDMPERDWFVAHIVVVATDLLITTWNQMREQLTRVIWHAVFCDYSFHNVWNEVVAKGESLKMESESPPL